MQGKLHQYHLIRALAKKYSHVTYLASLTDEPEHQVILKIFTSSLFRFPHEREKLLSKALRIKKLHHPHLVPILDTGIEQDQPFVVREYLPNGSLRSHLRKLSSHPLELGEALSIVSQVGSALAYAHEHNIVHGSLHPENILLDGSGQAVLTDFNLTNKNDALIRDQTTKEYAFCYLAPEQFAGTCNAKSDQYGLGCLAYELITGHIPFAAQSLVSMMGYHSNTEPVPLSERRVDLPPSLEIAVLKTLAKDPSERFDDFLLFLEVIQSILSLSPAFPFASSPHSRNTRTISHSTQSAKAKIVLSPIRKRAAKGSAPQQPKVSQTFFSSVADLTEPAITPAIPDISMPEWTGINSLSEPLTSILQPHQFTSPPSSGNTDLPSNGENDSPSVFRSHEIGTRASEHESIIASNASMANTDSPDSVISQLHDNAVFSSEPHSNANQIPSLQDAHDSWLTNLFEEQESNDLSPTSSANLGPEQHESNSDKMMVSLYRDRPVNRRTQPNRSKVFGLVLLCFVIVASGMYAAVFLSRTSKPDSLVRPTQVVNQTLMLVQNSITPTQLATPTATVQPTTQITIIPAVIPTPTPIPSPSPSPIVRQITAVDDSIKGTGVNQFNYVGSGWGHCTGGCNGTGGNCYNGSWTWDSTAGDYMTVSFTGIRITFYVVTGTYGGFGAISLDGGSETMVDFYSASLLGDQLMWTSPMMPAGAHTFKLRVTGTKGDPSSKDAQVGIDRVDILS
jgi:serine/threonine protein kinase